MRVLCKAHSFRAPVKPLLRPSTGVRFQQANTYVYKCRSLVAVPKACRSTCPAKLSPNTFGAFVAFQSAGTEAQGLLVDLKDVGSWYKCLSGQRSSNMRFVV